MAEIRSEEFGDRRALRDYRSEWLGDVLVERIIWSQMERPQLYADRVVAAKGYVWFRFWLPRFEQVVERYFDASGSLVGTKIDVCGPPTCDPSGCHATDLLLDIWIDPDGLVTIGNEGEFDEAARLGRLTEAETSHAEEHYRDLTAAIARGSFPPPIVRNWQVDLRRISQGGGDGSQS